MKEKILEILVRLCEDDVIMENGDVDLFETDLLDSLAFAELLFTLEDDFGVIIAPSEVERADLNTPNKIIALVEERVKQ